MSALLHIGVSKEALALRRIPVRLEFGTHVCLPADTTPAPSSKEDQDQQGPSHPGGPGLGTETMVSRTPGYEHLSFDQADSSGASPVASAWQGFAPEPGHFPPPCLEIERRQ